MWPTQIEKSWCSERCVWLLEVYPKSLCPRKKARKNQDHSVLYPHCLGGEYIYIYIYLVLCRELSFPHAPGCILVTTGDQICFGEKQISVLSLLADSWWFHWLIEPELWESQKSPSSTLFNSLFAGLALNITQTKRWQKWRFANEHLSFVVVQQKRGGIYFVHLDCRFLEDILSWIKWWFHWVATSRNPQFGLTKILFGRLISPYVFLQF